PYDWLHIESSFETVTGRNTNGSNLPLIPANNWTNTLRIEFTGKKLVSKGFARLDIVTAFDQNNVGQFESESEGYTLFNCGFGATVKAGKAIFDVSLNGSNLLNKSYIAHLSRLKTDGIPNIGRNIILGLNFKM
ncbi:MAG TPA: TonB-dependent receptor, partial [Flavobacterium sp.]|nr:TonB-dependent receptor [Flavobacterium sp.]